MRKKLEKYLSSSKNYLFPISSEADAQKEREQFIAFLEKNELFEKVLELVIQKPSWQKLADSNGICYFINLVEAKQDGKFPSNLPKVDLMIFDSGLTPVIKLSVTQPLHWHYPTKNCD